MMKCLIDEKKLIRSLCVSTFFCIVLFQEQNVISAMEVKGFQNTIFFNEILFLMHFHNQF